MSSNKPDPNKKVHWFLLSFMIPAPGQWKPGSFMGSYTSKTLSIPAINAMRDSNGISQDAVLQTISYIGLSSKHKMCGTSDEVVPTRLSEAYRQGLVAAMAPDNPQMPVTNPYDEFAGSSKEMMMNAHEWADGYAQGHTLRQLTTQIPAPVIET